MSPGIVQQEKNRTANQIERDYAHRRNAANTVAIVHIDTLASRIRIFVRKGCRHSRQSKPVTKSTPQYTLQNVQLLIFRKKHKAESSPRSSTREAAHENCKQQQQLQNFQMQIEGEMAKATQQYQQVLRDSLDNFLKQFNRDYATNSSAAAVATMRFQLRIPLFVHNE